MKAAVVFAVLLAGCASEPVASWYKAGASAQDYEIDHGQCTAQAFGNTTNLMQAAIIQNGCMRGKGWKR